MPPAAYLFDLDGTLIDSEPWHKKCEIESFASMGISLGEDDLLPYVGTTLAAMLDGICATFGRVITAEEFRTTSEPIMNRYIQDSIRAFDDAIDLLGRLDAPAALVTSSTDWYVGHVTTRFPWLSERFQVTVCGTEVSQGKPHPEPYLTAAERLGVEPRHCLVFEDSRNGVRSAKGAGCQVVGVDRYGDGLLTEADQVVSDLREWQAMAAARPRCAP